MGSTDPRKPTPEPCGAPFLADPGSPPTQALAVDVEAIRAHFAAPFCLDCGEHFHKCVCSHWLSAAKTVVLVCDALASARRRIAHLEAEREMLLASRSAFAITEERVGAILAQAEIESVDDAARRVVTARDRAEGIVTRARAAADKIGEVSTATRNLLAILDGAGAQKGGGDGK